MDINQLASFVQYLDEERRKDRLTIVQLQERVESLTREAELRTRYAQSFETQLNDLKQQLQKSMGWTFVVEQVRAEFSQIIERIEEQRSKSERESVRVRQIEIEALVRQLNEQKKEVKPYARYAEEIEAVRQEAARLNDAIAKVAVQVLDVERRTETPGPQIAYLEEQRRQDNKRIAAVEQEIPDLRRRLEQFPPQLLLLDEAVRRKQTEIEEAAKVLEAQNQVIESQRVSDVRRERQFAEYAEVVERLKERADAVAGQVTGFIQMRDEVRRAITEIPPVLERYEVRLNEVIEIQRDNDARIKRQADEFREVIEKEWKSFVVAQEEKWHDRDKRIADYEPRIEAVEEELPKFEPQILPLYDILDAFSKAYAAAGREWLNQSTQLLEKARANLPSDITYSRRQRRKMKAPAAATAPPEMSLVPANGSQQLDEFDQDLVT